MWRRYFRQAIKLFQQNKLLSIVSVIGTALSITMIMCIVIAMQVRTANFAPENKRNRMLSVDIVLAQYMDAANKYDGGKLSLRVIKECFYPLTTAEAVTAVIPYSSKLLNSPGEDRETTGYVLYTDAAFWKVFDFTFIRGTVYSEEEFSSGIKKAVISRSMAREIFNTEDVVGRTLSLSYDEYTICGVVKDVSVLADNAYADVWVPYTTAGDYERGYSGGLTGPYSCYILLPQGGKEEKTRVEVDRNVERLNFGQTEMKLLLPSGAPDNRLMQLNRKNMFDVPDVKQFFIEYGIVILILLLVPAINLSGLTFSRMRKRMEEIGVRRAFGAKRETLLWQILAESFFLTFIGAVVGLILSYLSVVFLRDWLLGNWHSITYGKEMLLNADILLQPGIFLLAVVFCLLLNLLSAGIPAYRISRVNIIDVLNS